MKGFKIFKFRNLKCREPTEIFIFNFLTFDKKLLLFNTFGFKILKNAIDKVL